MIMLTLACSFFLGIHIFISGTALRTWLVNVMGEKAYMAFFSLLSVAGLAWMIWAYGKAEPLQLWGQVTQARWLAMVLVLIAFLFIVLGILTPNPTSIGGENLIRQGRPVQGVTSITRHPFLAGAALWAMVHIAYNGDLPSLLFFGTFLLLALTGPAMIDAKQRQELGEQWQSFASQTSVIPFMAIAQGKNRLKLMDLGWWRIVAAILAYGAFAHFHVKMFGVSPMP